MLNSFTHGLFFYLFTEGYSAQLISEIKNVPDRIIKCCPAAGISLQRGASRMKAHVSLFPHPFPDTGFANRTAPAGLFHGKQVVIPGRIDAGKEGLITLF
ncbi:hypothetical protein FJW01_21800 [Pantoea deleyi]|uniref:Uncharacterized protein n=1 Tax=Pantoea deleyi TaxID=470932 RepID=A0A506PQQ5_9GAMM|nr:hypothetical protein [Pantoea deleyi]TPV36233.1 hypothetical protein FJW01_21800 [Pantoea deleyi]